MVDPVDQAAPVVLAGLMDPAAPVVQVASAGPMDQADLVVLD